MPLILIIPTVVLFLMLPFQNFPRICTDESEMILIRILFSTIAPKFPSMIFPNVDLCFVVVLWSWIWHVDLCFVVVLWTWIWLIVTFALCLHMLASRWWHLQRPWLSGACSRMDHCYEGSVRLHSHLLRQAQACETCKLYKAFADENTWRKQREWRSHCDGPLDSMPVGPTGTSCTLAQPSRCTIVNTKVNDETPLVWERNGYCCKQ